MANGKLVIVGAGLSGLFAGILAARADFDVTVIARGQGNLILGTGTIDIHSYQDRARLELPAFGALDQGHPYHQLSNYALNDSVELLREICRRRGNPLVGDIDKNLLLPTALGTVRPTALAPISMVAGDLRDESPLWIGHLEGFRDFYPQLMSKRLAQQVHVINLPQGIPFGRDAYTTDLARALDNFHKREQITNAWRKAVLDYRKTTRQTVTRIGLPAVLGLENPRVVLADVEDALECHVFEIPTLPPSVPGMRLYNILRAELLTLGGQLILGPSVTGEISKYQRASVTMHTANKVSKDLNADAILLATGGFGHHGLVANVNGTVSETVFDLPVEYAEDRSTWTAEHYLESHPYTKFGLRTNSQMQPLDAKGKLVADNIWACGSVLAGADRVSEGSREGISLATAFAAVENIIHTLS